MRIDRSIFQLILLIPLLFSCNHEPTDVLVEPNIIPRPAAVQLSEGEFVIDSSTKVFISPESIKSAHFLSDFIDPQLTILPASSVMENGNIYLSVVEDPQLGPEGYQLTVNSRLITLTAHSEAGLFHGIQTLIQMFHGSEKSGSGSLAIANCTIRDYPKFSYRGAMLDVSRHFFSVDDVKRFIDYLALYKMNALHLGLSNDQGWRIEIKSWPNLTAIGGATEVGGGEGGFYTQEDYKGIIKYAEDRHIMIIPEIDMPGHTNAALASYPALNPDGVATELYTGTNVGFSTLDTHNELTYEFIDDVIGELAAMTPGPYIHIGGDESHVTPMEDYIPFINRVQAIVKSHGKQAIGWDEIANASLDSGSVIQYWADSKNTRKAIEQNAQIIMSPAAYAYLDMKYDSATELGLNWAGYIEIDKGYSWIPEKLDSAIQEQHILGIEACLWTETISNMEELNYMVFPRLPGYAEIGWSQTERRNWEDYKIRLSHHIGVFQSLDINFYRSQQISWKE